MTKLLCNLVPVLGRERKDTMRKANERVLDSGIYARIREARMNESDRHNALSTLRSAELIVGRDRVGAGKGCGARARTS